MARHTLTIINGFAVFHAVYTTLGFGKRLAFAGYHHTTVIPVNTLATVIVATAVAACTGLILLLSGGPPQPCRSTRTGPLISPTE